LQERGFKVIRFLNRDILNNINICVKDIKASLIIPAPPAPPPQGRGGGRVSPFSGTTDIFITPGYKFKVADVLLTNFHLPKSTLFMLVCAFAGTEEMKYAYRYAIEKKYRFFSYGDCCLLFRKDDKK